MIDRIETAPLPTDPDSPLTATEPSITVNGVTLTPGQAMTVRVALERFAMDLRAGGLGDDEHGKAMTQGYLTAIQAIRLLIRSLKESQIDDR